MRSVIVFRSKEKSKINLLVSPPFFIKQHFITGIGIGIIGVFNSITCSIRKTYFPAILNRLTPYKITTKEE
jgi:hypothetical protein